MKQEERIVVIKYRRREPIGWVATQHCLVDHGGRRLHRGRCLGLHRQHLSVRTQALKTRIRSRHNLGSLIRGDDTNAGDNQANRHRPGNRRPTNIGRCILIAHVLLRLNRKYVGLSSRVLVGKTEPGSLSRSEVELALLACPDSGTFLNDDTAGAFAGNGGPARIYGCICTYVRYNGWNQSINRGMEKWAEPWTHFLARVATYRTVAGAIVRLLIMVWVNICNIT